MHQLEQLIDKTKTNQSKLYYFYKLDNRNEQQSN